MTFILQQVYTFINVFACSMLSFCQCKSRKSSRILHTGPSRIVDGDVGLVEPASGTTNRLIKTWAPHRGLNKTAELQEPPRPRGRVLITTLISAQSRLTPSKNALGPSPPCCAPCGQYSVSFTPTLRIPPGKPASGVCTSSLSQSALTGGALICPKMPQPVKHISK